MAASKPVYCLKIRSYPDCPFVSVWLLRKDGAAVECMLFRELPGQAAEELAAALSLPVERESREVAYEPVAFKQADLFG